MLHCTKIIPFILRQPSPTERAPCERQHSKRVSRNNMLIRIGFVFHEAGHGDVCVVRVRRNGGAAALKAWLGAAVRALSRYDLVLLPLLIAVMGLFPYDARAQIGSARYSSFVMEAGSGTVVSAVNPDDPRHPASLTKLMTLYMTFEALRDRRISLNEQVPVSSAAASMSPSKLGLTPGMALTVEQAIMGLVTKSANDAAAAMAELLGGGDERRFAQMMTMRARALGMTGTVFRNASGLPDPEQVSTARDLAVLARHLLQDFPQQYHYFSVPSFAFRGRVIPNHDHMLQTYPGADGLKTGYVNASGFNLVTSAVRGDVRLIGVVLGAAQPGERDHHMAMLLDAGFEQYNVPVSVARLPMASRAAGVLDVNATQTAVAVALTPPAPVLRDVRSYALAEPPRMPRQIAGWVAQLGVYNNDGSARRAANLARSLADGGEIRIEPAGKRRHPAYRASLAALTQPEAHGLCMALARRHRACAPVHDSDAGDVASR